MVAPTKYLKSDNQWLLFGFLVAHLIVFVLVNYFSLQELPRVFKWLKANFEVIGIMWMGIILMAIISNLVSPSFKAFLVFWRWPNPLPGYRAFSHYLSRDHRIDPERLHNRIGTFPAVPSKQNSLWYAIYRKHRNEPSVAGAHKDFLLTRDLTWLSIVLLVLLGSLSIAVGESYTPSVYYPACLLSQFLLTAIAAKRNGIRLVLNVLAVEAAYEDD